MQPETIERSAEFLVKKAKISGRSAFKSKGTPQPIVYVDKNDVKRLIENSLDDKDNLICPLCQFQINLTHQKGPHQPSLDRIDSDITSGNHKTYNLNNLKIVHLCCNVKRGKNRKVNLYDYRKHWVKKLLIHYSNFLPAIRISSKEDYEEYNILLDCIERFTKRSECVHVLFTDDSELIQLKKRLLDVYLEFIKTINCLIDKHC